MSRELQALLDTAEAADLLPARRAAEAARMARPLRLIEAVALGGERRKDLWFLVIEDARAVRYGVPCVVAGDTLRRARDGDGAAEALIELMASGGDGSAGPDVTTWHAEPCTGERLIDVDQTNELVVVGEQAVVKWLLHPTDDDQPAPTRMAALAAAGFAGTPRPWGLAHVDHGRGRALIATVTDYLPGTQDGWEWAVEEVRAHAQGTTGAMEASRAPRRLGALVAGLHIALATAGIEAASASDVRGWLADARADLQAAAVGDAVSGRIDGELAGIDACAGTPLIHAHGDLHIGQILRSPSADDIGQPPARPTSRR